jgi:hypothetical protein
MCLPIAFLACSFIVLRVIRAEVTDRAADAWSAYEGVNAKLWQIQMEHAARPSCLFDIRGNALHSFALSMLVFAHARVSAFNPCVS